MIYITIEYAIENLNVIVFEFYSNLSNHELTVSH